MNIGTVFGLGTLPDKNINFDVPGKYSDTYFQINGNGYDSSGRTPWQEHIKAAYNDELKSLFTFHGWDFHEPEMNAAAARVTKGRSNLYLHPQNFSGICENAERAGLLEAFQTAKTFVCTGVDVYDEIFDMSDDELAALLESKREAIESELLEAFTTKRRNLYITNLGFFGVNGKIAKRHSIKRVAIDGKKSRDGKDDCTNAICFEFVSGIFDELVSVGKIVAAQTKDGAGYRAAKKGDRVNKSA